MRRAGAVAALVAAGLALVVCGCSSFHVSETLRKMGEPGTVPVEEGLAQITKGETTRDELVDLLGPPAIIRGVEEGQELVYQYVSRRRETHTVVPIKKSTVVTHTMLVVTFELEAGVVTGMRRENRPLSEPAG